MYSDYNTIPEAVNAIIQMFEAFKRSKGISENVTYDIEELYQYLDSLADICCLIFRKETNSYAPQDKDWIKEKIYATLRQSVVGDNAATAMAV